MNSGSFSKRISEQSSDMIPPPLLLDCGKKWIRELTSLKSEITARKREDGVSVRGGDNKWLFFKSVAREKGAIPDFQ